MQLVQTPTQVTDRSSTLTDHAYSNREENIVDVHAPHYAISDHYPVCSTQNTSQTNCSVSVHNTITYRQMKNFDQTMFLQDSENQPWGILDIYDRRNCFQYPL